MPGNTECALKGANINDVSHSKADALTRPSQSFQGHRTHTALTAQLRSTPANKNGASALQQHKMSQPQNVT